MAPPTVTATWTPRPASRRRRRQFAMLTVTAMTLAACGGDDSGGLIDIPVPATDAPPTAADPTVPDTGAPDSPVIAEAAETEVREIDVTAYPPGFEVEIVRATIEYDPRDPEIARPPLVHVEALVTNLTNNRGRPSGSISVRAGSEQVTNEALVDPIDAGTTANVAYRFALTEAMDPDELVWWIEEDARNPIAVPLGAAGPRYTLEPIEIDVDAPEPFGSLTFEADRAEVVFSDRESFRALAGYGYVYVDVTATNTGTERAGFYRIDLEVDDEGRAPGSEDMGGLNLQVDAGETVETTIRFQFPIYGDRIVLRGLPGPNSAPVPLFDLEFPGLDTAIPDAIRPEPPS